MVKEEHATVVIDFTKEEVEKMLDLADQITVKPSENPEVFCRQCKEKSQCLPTRILEILREFQNHPSFTPGYIVFKTHLFDLDSHREKFEEIPITPSGNQEKRGETTRLAKIQAFLMQTLGEMISYEAEANGSLFQDVVPVKKMAKVQTSLGSKTELEIHTEQAFSELRPDYISLACLRGDNDAKTYILPVSIILEQLSSEEEALLWKPLWKTGVDLSFKLSGCEFIEGDNRGPYPILSGDESEPCLRFDQDLMYGINEPSQKMMKRIVDIYYQSRDAYVLHPGDILFLDNRRVVHGRSPFSPHYDGYDRFLIRCFGVVDLSKSEHARSPVKPRMIQAIYS